MRWLSTAVLLLILSIVHVIALGRVTEERNAMPIDEVNIYVMPSRILKIATLDFDGLASDYLFLKAVIFIGGAAERKESPKIKESEWSWIYNVLDTATDLDPYFLDPYYFANAYLTGDANMVREANALLEKGSRSRAWDWTLPFYIGFNQFFFLRDDANASEYFMQASRRPGGPSRTLVNFASKLAYKERRTENAIAFVEEIYKSTEDEAQRKQYEKRLVFLNNVLNMEKAVSLYKEKFKRNPPDLDALIKKQIIKELPKDPYGGAYFIDSRGIVRSTNDYALEPRQAPSRRQ